jgi:large subunit ribosomal protein L24
MTRFHVKKGDEVVVIAGAEKGKRGKVLSIESKKQRVVVEGVRMIKKHMRKNQNNPQGAIIEREGTVHVSNVMVVEKFDNRASKRGTAPATKE